MCQKDTVTKVPALVIKKLGARPNPVTVLTQAPSDDGWVSALRH